MKEAEIIQQILQGNQEAVNNLVELYYDDIFRYVVYKGCSYEEAMDITQEVFIKMMKSLHTYKEQGYFKAWLYRIAHNETMNIFRKKKQEIFYFQQQEQNAIMKDFSEKLVNQNLIQQLVKQLPEKQQEVVILKYYHGFKSKEIAKITGSTLPAVKSRLF